MTRDSIKTKIAALLAKAESTKNEFEAAAFMAKVNELLEKHQVELYEVRNAAGKDNDPMGEEQGTANIYASMSWANDLAGVLARYYGCRTVYWRRGNHTVYRVIGRQSARTTFELMLPFIITQVKLQARQLHQDRPATLSRWTKNVANALIVRIWKLIPKVEEHRASLEKNALVPVNPVDAFQEQLYPSVKTAKKRDLSHTQSAADAAEKISLRHQATGKHTKLLR
jgi:hypothetical protein